MQAPDAAPHAGRVRRFDWQRRLTGGIKPPNVVEYGQQEGNARRPAVIEQIAADEKKHADFWEDITGVTVKPYGLKIFHFF